MKLHTIGNIAILEYPENNNPTFRIDKDGRLSVFGYIEKLYNGRDIRSIKIFQTGLKNYTLLGRYDYAISRLSGDISLLTDKIDKENCVFMIKKDSIMKDDDYI